MLLTLIQLVLQVEKAEQELMVLLELVALEVPEQGLWNGSVSWRSTDDRWNVSLYGRNLADEEYIMDTLSTPASPGRMTGGAMQTSAPAISS